MDFSAVRLLFISKDGAEKGSGNFRLPPLGPNQALRPYQVPAYQKALRCIDKKSGFLLADEMGVGKTKTVLGVLSYMQSTNPDYLSIVAVPLSLIQTWREQAKEFCPDLKIDVVKSGDNVAFLEENMETEGDWRQVILVNHHTLQNHTSTFQNIARCVCSFRNHKTETDTIKFQ